MTMFGPDIWAKPYESLEVVGTGNSRVSSSARELGALESACDHARRLVYATFFYFEEQPVQLASLLPADLTGG